MVLGLRKRFDTNMRLLGWLTYVCMYYQVLGYTYPNLSQPAHASAIGNLAVHQFPERLAPSPPGTPLYAAAAAHHRRQHRLG